MINIKNQRGSITLFVLVSCLFFIASVACVHMYMQSKQVAVNREYRQIKVHYENNVDKMEEIYHNLQKMKKSVKFGMPAIDYQNKTISVNVSFNTEGNKVKTIKYGNEFVANKTNSKNNGFYYLCLMINDKAYWNEISLKPGYVQDGLIAHFDAINNVGEGDDNHSTSTNVWKDLSKSKNDISLIGFNESSTNGWGENKIMFDGNNYGRMHNVLQGKSEFTIEYVLNQKRYKAYEYLLGMEANRFGIESGEGGYRIFYINNKRYFVNMSEAIGDLNKIVSNTIVYKDKYIYIYQNGKKKVTEPLSDDTDVDTSGESFAIAAEADAYYKMKADYHALRIYERGLSDEEIAQNYELDKSRFNIPE